MSKVLHFWQGTRVLVHFLLEVPITNAMDDNGCQLKVIESVEGLTFPLISAIAKKVMPKQPDAFHQWFQAVEELGDYIGIRFGHIPLGAKDPEWRFYSHAKGDGIG